MIRSHASVRARAVALGLARAASGLAEDEASLRAASLAFYLIFCAAPICAMVLGLASMFPKAFSFLPSMLEAVGPRVLPSALDEAAAALRTFSANAGNLSLLSLVFSVASAFSLSMSIEKSVQACWGPAFQPASKGNALARHWLALTLTPCALALLGWAAYEALDFSPDVGLDWAPAALLFLFFLACSWALPSGKPPLWAACAASALAACECLLAQSAFGLFWARTQSYGAIYGAAAVFLGALLWIWLFWLSLLSSVSLCSTLALGRRRDLRSAGLDFLRAWLGEPARSAPEPASHGLESPPLDGSSTPPPLLAPSDEAAFVERLGLDPSFCDPGDFKRFLAERSDAAALREAFGGAVAARRARSTLLAPGSEPPLANDFDAINIQNSSGPFEPATNDSGPSHDPKA